MSSDDVSDAKQLIRGFRPRLPGFLEGAVGWLACLSVLLLSVPAFIRLPFNVPGMQGLTPQKVVQPVLFLAVIMLIALRRHVYRRADLPLVLMGMLVAWVLLSILANRSMDFTSNLRVWMWLLMAVGLAAGVAEATMRTGSAVRLLRAGGIAVAVVVAIGFLEVYSGSRFDSLFQLLRPNWTALGLRGPGPENILEVHAIFGASVRLMSTLGNDVVFFLPLGSILAASAYLGALTSGRRVASLGWLVLGGATGWAVLLTLSRTAIGLTLAGLVLFALLTSRQGWAATVWHPAMLFVALLTVNITVTDTPLVAKLRGMDALLKSVPAASKPPTIEAGPTASAALRAPEALGVEVRGKVASSSLETTIARWSINQRAIMASIAVDFARHNPVFGIGLWNFRTRLYERGGRWDELGFCELVKDVQCPHSFFLWLAAVAGVPGAILGAAVFAACLLSLARHWRQNPEHRLATSALIAAWVVLTGFALFGFTFLTTTAVGTFGSLVGVTSGYLGRSSQKSGLLQGQASELQIC